MAHSPREILGPREILDESPMSLWQIVVVGLTICLNALDGFDVLSISFSAPGIAKEWGIDRSALGLVLSAELVGMAIGSIFLGGVADRIGRRPTILGCLIVMAAGMALVLSASTIYTLMAWRVVTGLGIGGMLAAINAVVAEFSNAKRRGTCLALMVIGYPIGAVLGGTVAAVLLQDGDWRSVFIFGAIVTMCFIPLVWFFIPESPVFLVEKRSPNALEKINKTLRKFGLQTIESLPKIDTQQAKQSIAEILKPALRRTTILVTLAYFFHIISFYFILKWIPKLVVDMGYEPSSAAGVLVWANVGGAIGGGIFGMVVNRFGLKPMTIGVLVASTIMVILFGQGQSSLTQLALVAGCAGFFTNSAVVGLYSTLARVFPTRVRATGTGFAIGIGRGGAALAPAAAGFLFQGGYGLSVVATLMGMGSLVAAALLGMLVIRKEDGAETQ